MVIKVNKKRLYEGIKYSLIAEVAVGLLLFIIWIIAYPSQISSFPLPLYTLAAGGVLLLVGGCVGPGRYYQTFDIYLLTPEAGSAFSEYIPVGAFVIDDTIKSAVVKINNIPSGELKFKDNVARLDIKRDDIMVEPLNTIWLESDKKKSNSSKFTFFDFNELMTDEEIEEFSKFEEKQKNISLKDRRMDYLAAIDRKLGWLSVGIILTGIVTMLTGFLFDYVQNL